MKTFFRPLFFPAFILGWSLALSAPLRAQQASEENRAPAPVAPAAPATPTPPAAVPAPTTTASPAPAPDVPPTPTVDAATKAEATAPAESAAGDATSGSTQRESEAELRNISESAGPAVESTEEPSRKHREHHFEGAVVRVGSDAHLPEGEATEAVVAVFGSASSDGTVREAVVAILGNARATGRVGEDVVAVIGNVYVNSRVGGGVVAVLGNVELGPKAEVREVVSIGGTVKRDPDSIVHRGVQTVGIGPWVDGEWFEGLHEYFRRCVMLARPLAWSSTVMWAWWIALTFLGCYVLIALLFPSGVTKSAQTFETRPGSSIVAAILSVLLMPILVTLLAFTVIGAPLIPIVGIALFFIGIFGKAVVLAWLGRRITVHFGDGPLGHPVFAVLLGGAILLALYTVPVLGFIVYKLTSVLGVGIVIYTIILRSEREKLSRPTPPLSVGGSDVPAGIPSSPSNPSAAGVVAAAAVEGGASAFSTGTAVVPPPAMVPPPPGFTVPASTLPRAGFWLRTGALLLDLIIVALVVAMTSSLIPAPLGISITPPGVLPLLAIYGAVMWKTKGTTIGGIICGLKVVRIDGREIDWATAIVRALSCFLSLFVAGLGFIWVAIDADKQSWHDKIAGTNVVRVPKGVPLV